MSPIRQQLLAAIEQAPDTDLAETLQFLQSRQQSARIVPLDPSTQAWNAVVDRLKNLTPEQREHQRQAVSDFLKSWENDDGEEAEEESWDSLKIALDENRLGYSYRPLFP